MNDSQLSGSSLLITGSINVDHGSITSDGAGNVTINSIAGGISFASPVLASNGVVSVFGLRVSRVAPASAVTGIILAFGGTDGKEITIINESVAGNTITFDVAGTSNVANGASTVIAGLTSARFVWDSTTALWYHNV